MSNCHPAFHSCGRPALLLGSGATIESFNGLFRAECLNVHWFVSLEDAQHRIPSPPHSLNFPLVRKMPGQSLSIQGNGRVNLEGALGCVPRVAFMPTAEGFTGDGVTADSGMMIGAS
jgi:hypothetical protein